MKKDSEKKYQTVKSNTVPVAVIGIGCIFPQADNTVKFWTNIKDGVDSITEVPKTHWCSEDYYHQDPKAQDKVYAKLGGFLSPVEFNPMDYGILPNTIEAIDTAQLLGLLAVEQALEDAGYSRQVNFDRDKVSVVLGVTGTLELVIPLGARLGYPKWQEALQDAGVDKDLAEDILERISESYVPWQENSFPGLLGNVVAGRISKQFNFGGTNCVVDAACGSSLGALNMASLELATGRSDMVITGGIDTFNDIFMYTCFSKTLALSPSGHARPYDAESDGTTLGEGLGILVLKRLADAEQDGDKIYAVIKGIGTSSDGHKTAIYEPDVKGQKKALLRAYQQGNVSPDTIELIEGHGTGTKVGDAAEVSALQEVFGTAQKPWCALGSVKSQIGHTKAAAGSAGLIKAALALYHKTLPATIKVRNPLKGLTLSTSPFYLNTQSRPWLPRGNHPRRAGVSALGFGGSNFHCLLEEYQPNKIAVDWKGDVQVIPFSAADNSELAKILQSFPTTGSWSQLRLEAEKKRLQFKATDHCRLILVIEKNQTQRPSQLKTALAMLEKDDGNYQDSPDGVYYSAGANDGKIALLFPGQGAQYPEMLKDLAIQFPEFLSVLQDADNAFAVNADTPRGTLIDLIYPLPQFNQTDVDKAESSLRKTEVAQPALGAVSIAACQVLSHFGVVADMVAGHSYGELSALCAADVLSMNDLHYLSRIRGELMAADNDDRGGMLAVSAPLELIEDFLQEESLDLVLANRNTPTQGVLSGATTEIEKAIELLNKNGITCKPLAVSAAFHSKFIADAALPFSKKLKSVSLKSPKKGVFSNTTGSPYPVSVDAIKQLLMEQLINPVDFVSEIESMYQAGVKVFIEVGPGARLTAMVKSILGKKDHHSVALDSSNNKRSGMSDLARLLAQLSVLGKTVKWSLWDEGFASSQKQPGKKTSGMTVSLCGANYYKKPGKRPPIKSKSPATIPQTNQMPVERETISQKLQQQVNTDPTLTGNHQAALQITQQSMQTLRDLQEQTSSLHQQFLEGQQAAIESLMKLADQQHQMLQSHLGTERPEPLASMMDSQVETVDVVIQQSEKSTPEPTPKDAGKSSQVNVAPLLLEIIAEKTGYPVEMLELEMTLDTDLGIDSIKRVEILSAMQEKLPNAPAIPPEELASLQTLGQIVDHLSNNMPLNQEIGTNISSNGSDKKEITVTMLKIVAEKTGYPVEMLELEMALDSDLGIDSIKRVEILSAMQEKLPNAPAIPPEELASLQTLGQIIDCLCKGAFIASKTGLAGNSGDTDKHEISTILLDVIAEKTGYPIEMLELEMSLDTDLGIDSIKRVEILSTLQERLPGTPKIKPDHLGTLQTVRQIVDFLTSVSSAEVTELEQDTGRKATSREITRQVLQTKPLQKNRPVKEPTFSPGAEIWITDDGSTLSDLICDQFSTHQLNPSKILIENISSLVVPEELAGLVILAPQNGTDDLFLINSFKLLQQVEPALQKAAQTGKALFATVSRIDGHFGLNSNAQINDPLSGGLSGLCKTAALEWPEVCCKVIDLATGIDGLLTAEAITEEVLKENPIEVGITHKGLLGLELVTKKISNTHITMPVQAGDLVVISGGARGVTAEVAVALSAASKATLLLLGRSQIDDKEPEWLSHLTTEAEIKRALVDNSNTPLKPMDIAHEYRRISAAREIRTTLDRIIKKGGKAIYRAVDLRNRQAVREIIDEINSQYGPVKGLIHGAGILADKLITEKTKTQFEQVYSTKVEGLRTLLDACDGNHLKFMVMFSSSSSRFGRVGQADYAAANEVLNKFAHQQAKLHPNCRVLSLNWGPWNGGMVTPALKKVFQQEGIGVIDLQAGADYLLKEISTKPGGPVELVISGGNPEKVREEQPGSPGNIHVSKVFDLSISIDRYPFLKSHILDGKAVLPMAIIIEWLAHGAIHNNPGFKFQGFNDLRILKGVIIESEEVYNIQVMAGKAIKSNGCYIVPVELSGTNIQGKQIAHARSKIVLSSNYTDRKSVTVQLTMPEYPHGINDIYQPERLFHGKDFHGIREMVGCSGEGISALAKSAPSPEHWIEEPLRNSWFADPLVLDTGFQLITLWSIEQYQAGSLPVFAGRYRQYQERFPKTGIEIRARIIKQNSSRAFADIDFINPLDELLIARLENYECVIDASLKATFRRNKLSGVA